MSITETQAGPRWTVEGFGAFWASFSGVMAMRFVIGRIDQARPVRLKSIHNSECWMVQIVRLDADILDEKSALDDFVKVHVRGESIQRDRKVRIVHLRAENVAERLVQPSGSVDVPLVSRHEERREKWQPLNMVPVRVRDQNMPARSAAFGHQHPAKRVRAGAGVDQDGDAGIGRHLHA